MIDFMQIIAEMTYEEAIQYLRVLKTGVFDESQSNLVEK